MTGPEHYREAENALTASTWQYQKWGEGDGPTLGEDALRGSLWEMRRAQVHATLALAAAVATDPSHLPVSRQLYVEWRDTAGDPERPRL